MTKKAPKLRLLIATGVYPPDIGGPATYTALLERELPKHDIEVSVMPFSSVRKLPKVIRHISYFIHVFAMARKCDVVMAMDPVSTGFPAHLAATLLRKRFMVRLGGDYAWEMASLKYNISETPHEYVGMSDEYPTYIKLLRKIQTRVTHKADIVFTQSEYLKRVIVRWGIKGEKVVVIPNGFEEPKKLATKELLRKLMHLEEAKVIISVGRLIPLKGFAEIVSFMPKILKEYPTCKLIIVGDGQEYEALEAQIERYGLQESVSLTGALKKDVLYGYIKAADVFLLNARHETFPNLLIEAMTIGTPVVATAVGGIPEIIDHNKDGLLVPYSDEEKIMTALKQCFTNKELTLNMTRLARIKAKKFSVERAIGAIVKELLT